MKITFQMGYGTRGVVPDEINVEFNTRSNYNDYVFALTMIHGIIAAKINECEAELQKQAVAASEENDYQLAC